MPKEIWLAMKGFEGRYEISSLGRIRRLFTSAQHKAFGIFTPRADQYGYSRTTLRDDSGRVRRISVHVAVLESFVGDRPKGHDASHINGIRTDNRLENLRWETASDNHQRKLEHGTLVHGEAHKCSKLKENEVIQIRRRAMSGERKRKLAREFGVSGTLVCRIVAGKAWPHAAIVES